MEGLQERGSYMEYKANVSLLPFIVRKALISHLQSQRSSCKSQPSEVGMPI